MITIQHYNQLGHADHGWLNARHHFSFADYHDPQRMGFGAIRVINDDVIKPGTGFATHPHRNMEIITYVREGTITHKDNQGNEGRTQAGDVQVMSAGSGIFHSEYNLEDVDTSAYQIWIKPDKRGVTPRWQNELFPKQQVKNKLKLLVSGTRDAPLFIHQDANIYAGKLSEDLEIQHAIRDQAYLLISKGEIKLDNQVLTKGDGAQITEQACVHIKALSESEVLIIDVPH